MKKFLLLGLSLLVAVFRTGLFIFLQYTIISFGINATYESKTKPSTYSSAFDSEFFQSSTIKRSSELLEERNSALNALSSYIIAISIVMGLVIISIWIVTLILTLTKKEIPASILTIIFLSVIIGIIMLVTRKKRPALQTNNKPSTPVTNTQKVESKPKYQCDYCDRILDKFYAKCPYCGGDLKK